MVLKRSHFFSTYSLPLFTPTLPVTRFLESTSSSRTALDYYDSRIKSLVEIHEQAQEQRKRANKESNQRVAKKHGATIDEPKVGDLCFRATDRHRLNKADLSPPRDVVIFEVVEVISKQTVRLRNLHNKKNVAGTDNLNNLVKIPSTEFIQSVQQRILVDSKEILVEKINYLTSQWLINGKWVPAVKSHTLIEEGHGKME